jgi:hypothetical protein
MSNPFLSESPDSASSTSFPNGSPPPFQNSNQNPPNAPLFPVDDSSSVILQPASVGPTTGTKRGRPRTKVQPADVRTFGSLPGPPPPRAPGTPPSSKVVTDEDEQRRRKQERKDKDIKSLQAKIVKEFNEQLLEGLSTLGIPAAFIWKDGNSPIQVVDSNLTPMAQAICINPMQANWMAHGIVEAKEFPAIQKLMIGKQEGPSYLWLALGGLGLISYLQGLFTAVSQMRKLMAELQAIQNSLSPDDLRQESAGMSFQEQGPM